METKPQRKPVDQVAAAIQALDLAPIKFKLMDKEEGYGWSREAADANEIEYKRFLTLVAKYPGASIAPTKDVDKFWHSHILDTLKYAEDCENVFGYFLHHFPYFGMRGEEDAANLAAAADTTRALYEKEFGAAVSVPAASFCGAATAVSFCGAATNGQYAESTAKETGFCGAATTVAFCGAMPAGEDASARSAFCGAATLGGADGIPLSAAVLKTALRPTLPAKDAQ